MNKRSIISGVASILLLAGAVVAFWPNHSSAVTGSDWSAARIVDDYIYFNSGSMNPGDIQNFLNAKVPTCDTNGTQPSNHSGYPTRADWGRANGAPPPYVCLRDFTQTFGSIAADSYCNGIGGGTKGGADIIFNVAQACGVNPKALIVLLQKEQGLITDDWPWPVQYRSATGYGCPDTAPCDAEYYGFFNQVYNAAHQFKVYTARPDLFNFAVGRNSFIQYNPNSGCGGGSVALQTQATAALYNYTPYQPNAAALANLYGTGDGCSAYGNRNFWRMFNDWFGPTLGDGYTLAVNQSDNNQYVLYGGIKQLVPSPEIITAYGLPSTPVPMPADYLATIPNGPPLGRLLHLNGSPTLYFVDSGKKYQVTSPQMRDAWGLTGQVESYVSQGLFAVPQDAGSLTFAVKNASNPTQYMIDGPNGSGQIVLRSYNSPDVKKAWEGDTAGYTVLSDTYFGQIDNAIGAALTSSKITYGGNEYQVVAGQRMNQPANVAPLYPAVAQTISGYTFNRLVATAPATHLARSASSPDVYLLDAGVKHHLPTSDVLAAWSFPSMPVNIVDDGFMNLIPSGADLNTYLADTGGQLYVMSGQKVTVPVSLDTAYRHGTIFSASATLTNLFPTASSQMTGFLKPARSPQVYLLDNSGQRRYLDSAEKAGFWGSFANNLTTLPDAIVNSLPTAANPSLFVSDGTNSYLMDGGLKWSVSPSVKAAWGLGTPQTFSDGTLSRFGSASALDSSFHDGNNFYLLRGGKAYLTVDQNIADTWGIKTTASHSNKLLSNLGTPGPFMLTRFVKSSVGGDNRTFIIDAGNWYNLSAAQRSNLGDPAESTMQLDPGLAPNTITDWTSVVVQDHSNKMYVIDGGTKRSFANPVIQNWWTSNNSLSVPTMSNGFLNLLPNNGTIERAVKGGSLAVYSAEGANKRWILSGNTYQQSYAPFAQVSDQLLNAMASGANIP
jgi:hypothetical protein